jgi:hypothetical protein
MSTSRTSSAQARLPSKRLTLAAAVAAGAVAELLASPSPALSSRIAPATSAARIRT